MRKDRSEPYTYNYRAPEPVVLKRGRQLAGNQEPAALSCRGCLAYFRRRTSLLNANCFQPGVFFLFFESFPFPFHLFFFYLCTQSVMLLPPIRLHGQQVIEVIFIRPHPRPIKPPIPIIPYLSQLSRAVTGQIRSTCR